jgi:hypothetical protein
MRIGIPIVVRAVASRVIGHGKLLDKFTRSNWFLTQIDEIGSFSSSSGLT